MFQFAFQKNIIDRLSQISIPSQRSIPRPKFSDNAYRKLYRYFPKYLKSAPDEKTYRDGFYIRDYILILYNTGVRVGELRSVRWIYLGQMKGSDGQPRLMVGILGKQGQHERR